jgi:hypothetical protein
MSEGKQKGNDHVEKNKQQPSPTHTDRHTQTDTQTHSCPRILAGVSGKNSSSKQSNKQNKGL